MLVYRERAVVDGLMTSKEAAEHLRMSPRTLVKWRAEGRGPNFVRLEHSVRYRMADLETFIKEGGA